jgi:hypothetical protein
MDWATFWAIFSQAHLVTLNDNSNTEDGQRSLDCATFLCTFYKPPATPPPRRLKNKKSLPFQT